MCVTCTVYTLHAVDISTCLLSRYFVHSSFDFGKATCDWGRGRGEEEGRKEGRRRRKMEKGMRKENAK